MEKELHHAYLVLGGSDEGERAALSFLKEWGIGVAGNPDIHFFRTPLFGIDDARRVRSLSARKSFGTKKIFILLPERISDEAQNALLKTLEDPAPDTHYFLSVRHEDILLPTVRSRMMILRSAGEASHTPAEFLALRPAERLNFVRKFIEDERPVGEFLDGLLGALREKGSSREILERMWNVRKYAEDTSGGRRIIMEHVALIA